MQAESPLRTPPEMASVGQLSFAEAQALLFRLDTTLPPLNGARSSLAARAEHAAELADRLEKAEAELHMLRSATLPFCKFCSVESLIPALRDLHKQGP